MTNLPNQIIYSMKKKVKLFEDYSNEVREARVLPKNVNYFEAV